MTEYVPTQVGTEDIGPEIYTEADLAAQAKADQAESGEHVGSQVGTEDLGDDVYTEADKAAQAAAAQRYEAEGAELAEGSRKADLQAQAEALGLDSSGTKAEIAGRITAHQDTGAGTEPVAATNATTAEGAGAV